MEIDLCISHNYPYDQDAVNFLDALAARLGLRTFIVHDDLILDFFEKLTRGEARVRVMFDRASDNDPRFLVCAETAKEQGSVVINDPAAVHGACDKGRVFLGLQQLGVDFPQTIVLPPWNVAPDLQLDVNRIGDLLSRPLVAKPASGGGGEGVCTRIETTDQIVELRNRFPDDSYLLQERIVPAWLGPDRAWFRAFVIGRGCHLKVIPTLWNCTTHEYRPFPDDLPAIARRLESLAQAIQMVTDLDFFTFEAALTVEDRLVVIDPNNDQPDLRNQHHATTGVPVKIWDRVLGTIAEYCQVLSANPKSGWDGS